LKDNFRPGDQLVTTTLSSHSRHRGPRLHHPHRQEAAADQQEKRVIDVTLPDGAQNATLSTVDEASGEGPARASKQEGTDLNLAPFAVVVVSLP